MNTRWMTAATISVVALSLFATGAAGANADSAPESQPQQPQQLTSKAISHHASEAAENYWTAERMQKARSADLPASKPHQPSTLPLSALLENGKPQEILPTAPDVTVTPESGPVPQAANENPMPTIGKVFFKKSGRDFVCSGNVVTSANGSTVSTAGHCVGGAYEGYYSNFVFVPAYSNGSAPYGVWPAQTLTTTNEWMRTEDFNYDTAFVKLHRKNNQSVASRVGATGLAFNQARGLSYKSFGYPADRPFNGEVLKSCQGGAHNDPQNSWRSTQGFTCDMTGGSSGGPWFISGDRRGIQNSVNSYGYPGEVPPTMYGPYWGQTIQALYNWVQAS